MSQKPQAGEHVRTGTAVDVLVSRQVTRQLTVMVDQANPKRGEALGFHAHMEPPRKGMKYRFTFGDGERSAWLTTSRTTHTYRSAGDFQVQAFAAADDTTITSEIVTVAIPPFPWAIVSALTVGVLALGGAGFLYRGWSETFLGPAGAIILSSIVWTGLHLQYDWYFFGEVFSIGLWLGYLRYRSGSIWLTIVLHGLNNLGAVVQTVWLAG